MINYSAHRVVVAPHQMEKNIVITIDKQKKWQYLHLDLGKQTLERTLFYNGLLFPVFSSPSQAKFKKFVINRASLDEVLFYLCYAPWLAARELGMENHKKLAWIEVVNWENNCIQEDSVLKVIH